jgi:hypothetical protein
LGVFGGGNATSTWGCVRARPHAQPPPLKSREPGASARRSAAAASPSLPSRGAGTRPAIKPLKSAGHPSALRCGMTSTASARGSGHRRIPSSGTAPGDRAVQLYSSTAAVGFPPHGSFPLYCCTNLPGLGPLAWQFARGGSLMCSRFSCAWLGHCLLLVTPGCCICPDGSRFMLHDFHKPPRRCHLLSCGRQAPC